MTGGTQGVIFPSTLFAAPAAAGHLHSRLLPPLSPAAPTAACPRRRPPPTALAGSPRPRRPSPLLLLVPAAAGRPRDHLVSPARVDQGSGVGAALAQRGRAGGGDEAMADMWRMGGWAAVAQPGRAGGGNGANCRQVEDKGVQGGGVPAGKGETGRWQTCGGGGIGGRERRLSCWQERADVGRGSCRGVEYHVPRVGEAVVRRGQSRCTAQYGTRERGLRSCCVRPPAAL